MAERGIAVDHSTINHWVGRFALLLAERFNRRKRAATGKWHRDETYSMFTTDGRTCTALSTASAAQWSSGSVSIAICRRQNAFCKALD